MALIYLAVAVITQLRGGMLQPSTTTFAAVEGRPPVPVSVPPAPAAHARAAMPAPAGSRSGIDPRELPYEGHPPDAPAARSPVPGNKQQATGSDALAAQAQDNITPSASDKTPAERGARPQAASRHQAHAHAAAPATPPSHKAEPVRRATVRTRHWPGAYRVAQCEREPSLFAREACKWRLCADQWGRNGCPAYNHTPKEH